MMRYVIWRPLPVCSGTAILAEGIRRLMGEKEAGERMKIKFSRIREILDRGDAIESAVRFVVQSLRSH